MPNREYTDADAAEALAMRMAIAVLIRQIGALSGDTPQSERAFFDAMGGLESAWMARMGQAPTDREAMIALEFAVAVGSVTENIRQALDLLDG